MHSGAAQKEKLPRPQQLDHPLHLERDPATGELVAGASTAQAPGAHAIHVSVDLVPVTCAVLAPDGTTIRGLNRGDFRLFDDGAEQKIAYFDSSSLPARLALLIDASPSVLPDSSEMLSAAEALVQNLSPDDEVALVDFSEHAYILAPFSKDRALLERAIAHVDVPSLFKDAGGTNIYRTVYFAAHDLFAHHTGRKAIVLLTDGQDSGMGLTLDPSSASPRRGGAAGRLTFDDVAEELAAHDIQVFAISTQHRPKTMTAAWLADHAGETLLLPQDRRWGIPAYTLYLAEIVRRSGGALYFLHESGSLDDAYRRVAANIGAEYTLGFYPASDSKAGRHLLRVEVAGRHAQVVHRESYEASRPQPSPTRE